MTRTGRPALDWNVVATTRSGAFPRALRLLEGWGPVARTDYYNVVVLRVDDPASFPLELRRRLAEDPAALAPLARVVPCRRTFEFRSAEEFAAAARVEALAWAPELAGAAFHVRMHRRGLKKRLSSQEAEQFLAEALLAELEARGTPGRISFDDPDAILSAETVAGRGGLSLWSREELRACPFLGLE